RGAREREAVVERPHARELGALHELLQQRGARHPLREPFDRPFASLGLGVPAEYQPPEPVDDLRIVAVEGVEPGRELGSHPPPTASFTGNRKRTRMKRASSQLSWRVRCAKTGRPNSVPL